PPTAHLAVAPPLRSSSPLRPNIMRRIRPGCSPAPSGAEEPPRTLSPRLLGLPRPRPLCHSEREALGARTNATPRRPAHLRRESVGVERGQRPCGQRNSAVGRLSARQLGPPGPRPG